ncbi:hypothetical protein L6255_02285 [Candidatus Parcubacteria bacterium]|nr:hypothetical protein [Patescibacteria group bacterium]MCG2689245.1 hypothetical protein [Candidatus Parcubacteria bacterium]
MRTKLFVGLLVLALVASFVSGWALATSKSNHECVTLRAGDATRCNARIATVAGMPAEALQQCLRMQGVLKANPMAQQLLNQYFPGW